MLGVVVVGAIAPATAAAHAVLIGALPAIGSHIEVAPSTIELRFSEPVAVAPDGVELIDPSGRRARRGTPELIAGGATVRVRVDPSTQTPRFGVYVVVWRAVSADGDPVSGSFQFAIGSGTPDRQSQTGATGGLPDLTTVLARGLLLLGLALAVAAGRHRRWALAGVVTATAGALGLWAAQVTTEQAGRSVSTALRASLASRPEALAATTFALLALATLGIARERKLLARGAIVAAIVALVAGGHASVATPIIPSIGLWALHAGAAIIWLASLARAAWIVASSAPAKQKRGSVNRYARIAIASLIVLAVTGIYQSVIEIREPGLLTSTTYGQALLVKGAMVAATLALALFGRTRGLAGLDENPRPLSRTMTVEVAFVAAAILVGAVMAEGVPARSEALARRLAAVTPPPTGPALRLADLAGSNTVGIAVMNGAVLVNLLDETAAPLTAKVTITVRTDSATTSPIAAHSCGAGCYAADLQVPNGLSTLQVTIRPPNHPAIAASFPIRWPLPPDATALVRSAVARLAAEPAIEITEIVTSDSTHAFPATITTLPGADLIAALVFAPDGATDARLLGVDQIDGRSLRHAAYYLPGANLWHELWIDNDLRIYRHRLISPGHRILDSYRYP